MRPSGDRVGWVLGERQLVAAVEASPDAFVAVDRDGRILHWSAAAERVLGWPASAVLGGHDPSVPEDSAAATAAVVRMLAAGEDPGLSWQVPRVTRDGRRVQVQVTGWVPLDDGAFGVYFREPDPGEARAHLRNRLSQDLAAVTGRGEVVEVVARALEQMVGATGVWPLVPCRCGDHLVAEVEGHCPADGGGGAYVLAEATAGTSGERRLAHADLRLGGATVHVCLVPMGPQASTTWLAVEGVHEALGDRHGLVSVRGVADEAWVALQRARLVVALQGRVDRLEALDASRSEAIAGVTHDLKAPVHVLRGFLDTLRARPDGTVDPARAYDAMERQIARLETLVDDLWLAARAADGPIRPSRRDPVDLSALATDVAVALDPSGTRVRVTGETTVLVDGDVDQLQRVVVNLVDNALKYGAERPVTVSVRAVAHEVVLVVRDHGPGLAPDEHDRVFGRFAVGRAGQAAGATGLGLHVAREIARGHGGALRSLAPPADDPGGWFELRLPAGHGGAPD